MRKGLGDTYQDVKVLFEGEDKPVWYVYAGLQALRAKGQLDVIDAGPRPGLLARLLRR
jgi:hypothetical protein